MASTVFKGFGLAPAGTAPFGFGAPALADPNIGQALTKTDGSQGEARSIDPRTRDYAFDEKGRVKGIDSVQQQVYLALVTVRDSSSVTGLGQLFSSIKLITANLQTQMTNEVRQALSRLIAENKVQLVSVRVELTPSKAALVHVEWLDLTKGTGPQIVSI